MRVVYPSRLYVTQTVKKNSIADISISFMLFTIYKEIQIGFGKLLNQYKKKDWQNPEYYYFWKNLRNSGNIVKIDILASIDKISFWKEDWALGYNSMKFWHDSELS